MQVGGALHHMIVGDDVTGTVPDEPGSSLHAATVFLLGQHFRAGGRRPSRHLDDGGRRPLEDIDRQLLEVREIAAGLDGARLRLREQQPVDGRPQQIDADDKDDDGDKNTGTAAHDDSEEYGQPFRLRQV